MNLSFDPAAFLEQLCYTYMVLFPFCNPLHVAGIFLGMTSGFDRSWRRHQAFMGSAYMCLLLVAFFLAGQGIMKMFGFTLDAVRLAGGFVIGRAALEALKTSLPAETAEGTQAVPTVFQNRDISFAPLGTPVLAGPGALSTIMSLSPLPGTGSLTLYVAIFAAIFITGTTTWLGLRHADVLLKAIGPKGYQAFSRIMGFLVLSLAAQFVINGTTNIFQKQILPQLDKVIVSAVSAKAS